MLFIAGFALIPQVQERFLLEYDTITTDDTVNDFIGDKDHESLQHEHPPGLEHANLPPE
jgi:hypothetical protein